MKTRCTTKPQRSSSNSRNRLEDKSEPIPFDLIIEILTRSPAKSIARFRCVSKLWESTIRNPIFTESFFAISSSRRNYCSLFLNTAKRSSSHHHSLKVLRYFGYDPINKQMKVLCMSIPYLAQDHQVLTLGTGKELSWRMIQCDISYNPITYQKDICINGVLYYFAWLPDADPFPNIICFDIRSEKFYCLQIAQDMMNNYTSEIFMESTLVNYKGKIAMLHPIVVNCICTGIQLWVSEDADKHQWSSQIYVWPVPWKNNIKVGDFCIVGMTGLGEIVLSPAYIADSFYLLYYNPERKNITRVEIQGMEGFKHHKVHTFLDHVENVIHMESVLGS